MQPFLVPVRSRCSRRASSSEVRVSRLGLGDRFDGDKVEAYPLGSVIVLPGNTSHFHWAKSGEYITQVTRHWPAWP
jgi:hypothetical protein